MNHHVQENESSGSRKWILCLKNLHHMVVRKFGFMDPLVGGAHQDCSRVYVFVVLDSHYCVQVVVERVLRDIWKYWNKPFRK